MNEKQQKLYFNSKILLDNQKRDIDDTKNNVQPKTPKQIEAENVLKIDEQTKQKSILFVRINTKIHFTRNSRFNQGQHVFKEEQDFGSMVINPGYEVELTYKKNLDKKCCSQQTNIL